MINATTEQQCKAHHYRIEEPRGPRVQGVCKVCGHERTYASGDQYAGAIWHNSSGERYIPNGSGERYVP